MQTTKHIHSELIGRCRNGDRRAQYELYKLYSVAMLNTSFRILQNKEEAEDVLQECFVKMFKSLDSFREEASFGSWFKRIVVNASLNRLKKRKIQTTDLQEGKVEEEQTDTEEDSQEPAYSIQEIQSAVGKLPDGFRAVFSLYMFEDYSHKEIASTLGITESTSKSQLNRAKKKVKQWLIETTR